MKIEGVKIGEIVYMPVKVAEGGYGCVFRPALECSKNALSYVKKGKYVSKAMTKQHAKSELSEYKRIDKADPSNKYHLEAPKQCKMAQNQVNLDAVKQCKVLENVSPVDVALLQLKDGGVSLKEFANSKPKRKQMENFLVDFYNIVLALKLLYDEGLHHMDLKPHNIVYNPEQRLMLMIDFGLMLSSNQVVPLFYYGKPVSHWNYPPEVYILRYHSRHPDHDYATEKHLSFQATNGTKSVVDYLKFDKYETSIYINNFEQDIKHEDIDNIQTKSMITHDVFGAGLSLLYVLRLNSKSLDKDVFQKFDQMGKDMMHGSPLARLTPILALDRYEFILEDTGLLKSQNKKIVDGSIVNRDVSRKSETQRIMMRIRKIPNISKTKLETITAAEPPPMILCPEGKEQVGKRCLKKCANGFSRNTATNRCKKIKERTACPEGKERNPITNRCVKKCGPGQVRSEKTRRCIKAK